MQKLVSPKKRRQSHLSNLYLNLWKIHSKRTKMTVKRRLKARKLVQKWIFIYRRWKTPKKRAQKGSQRKKSFRCLAKSKNRDLEKLFISFIHMAQSEARCQINKSQFKNYLKSTVFNFLPFLIMLFCETSKINKLKWKILVFIKINMMSQNKANIHTYIYINK